MQITLPDYLIHEDKIRKEITGDELLEAIKSSLSLSGKTLQSEATYPFASVDLTQRRKELSDRQEENYSGIYTKLIKDTMKFIDKTEETDEYIKLGKLKLRKKPLTVNVNHPKNKDKDVFTYEWDNYSGGKDTMVGIRQKVLNDESNDMHPIVQQALESVKPYRQATKADFDHMLSELPGKNEEQKLLALQIVTGWFGYGMLDAVDTKKGVVLSSSFVGLYRNAFNRCFYTNAHQDTNGSVFLVQDCE